MFKIDKRIKPPAKTVGRPTQGPWRELGIGHSFFLPGKDAAFRTSYWTKQTGYTYVTRAENNDGIDGVRVWRIKGVAA